MESLTTYPTFFNDRNFLNDFLAQNGKNTSLKPQRKLKEKERKERQMESLKNVLRSALRREGLVSEELIEERIKELLPQLVSGVTG